MTHSTDPREVVAQLRPPGPEEVVCEFYPRLDVVHATDGEVYKVRTYATEAEAKEKESLLTRIGSSVRVQPILGRAGNSLVFAYLQVEPGDVSEHPAFFRQVGMTLAYLEGFREAPSRSAEVDETFNGWLRHLSRSGFVSPWAVRKAARLYKALRPREPRVCVVYLDAMPPNFGWVDGELYLLDEKHFKLGYEGISLIKPYLAMPHERWQEVREGYAGERSMASVQVHWEFLKLYYLAFSLYFYALGMAIGATSISTNPRLRRFRQAFVADLFPSKLARSLEWLYVQSRFSMEAVRYNRMRLRRRMGTIAGGESSAALEEGT